MWPVLTQSEWRTVLYILGSVISGLHGKRLDNPGSVYEWAITLSTRTYEKQELSWKSPAKRLDSVQRAIILHFVL